ncbi:MAG: hypothetical protein NTZ09_07760 [Candidatus Hydrogenedentes bacterium]|nr:hypothetical protein [Candidatus Hydrogenedentota bacterium]
MTNPPKQRPERRHPPRDRNQNRPAPRPLGGINTRWAGFRPLFDYWGNEIVRFYKLETLASAVDWSLHTKRDRFLIPSIQEVLGPAPVVSLAFELFQEGRYQFIFRLRALNARRKEAFFAFVVAKRADYSKLAALEHANLRVIHERAPDFVVRPFRGGNIYLPDRHGRVEHGRDIYAYVTQWLAGFHELGVNDRLQFIINVKARHTFTIDQTEQLKAKIIEIVAKTYSPKKRDCMDLPEIASGDLVVTAPPKPLRLKLIACRRMLRNITPVKLLDKIAAASWPWGDTRFYLAPQDARMFYDAFARAFGQDIARDTFTQYAAAVQSGKLPERDALPRHALAELTS